MKFVPCFAVLTFVLNAGLAHADDAPAPIGRVVDSQDQPIAGATVYAWKISRKARQAGTLAPADTTVTDERGNWSFPGLDPKVEAVIWGAWKLGYTFGSTGTIARGMENPSPRKITLDPVKPVSFHLVDWSNHPVKEATATLVSRGRGTDRGGVSSGLPSGVEIPDAAIRIKAGPDGTIVAPFGADKDLLAVRVEAPTFQSAVVMLSVPQDDGLTVRLAPGAAIHGRLVDGAGQPVEGSSLGFQFSPDKATAQPDGTFRLAGLDDAPNYLELGDPDHILQFKMMKPARGTDTDVGDLVCVSGGILSGKVTDVKTGKPLRGTVEISPTDQAPDIERPWMSQFGIGDDGQYSLRLPPGDFEVTFYDDRGQIAPFERPVSMVDGKPATLDLAVDTSITINQGRSIPVVKTGAAQPPAPDYIYGSVRGKDGKPIAGALVTVYQGDQAVRDTRTSENGRFAVGPLRGDMSPGGGNVGGLAAGTVDRPAPKIFVRAEAPGLIAASAVVPLGSDAPVVLKLSTGQDLRLQLVDTDGKPVPGAKATVNKLTNYFYGPDGPKAIPSPRTETLPAPVTSNADGLVTLTGLPGEGFCELSLEQPDFAPLNLTVALPRLKPVETVLRKPAVVEGKVLFGDETLKGQNFQIQVKANWLNSLAQTGTAGADGHFEVKNLPSSRQLNYDLVTISLAPVGDKAEVAPGLKLENIAPGQNSNVYLTDSRGAVTHRWIGYVDQLPEILDGQSLHRDIVLHAMAHITGKVPSTTENPDPSKMMVMYRDRNLENKLTYTDPVNVPVDKEGKFDVWIPAGDDVALEVKLKGNVWNQALMSQVVQAPVADETREVTFAPEVQSQWKSYFSQPVLLRAVGPDGATVPRVQLHYRIGTAPIRSGSTGEGGMDGLMQTYLGINPKGQTLEITCDYLDKPYLLKYDENQPVQRVPLSRVPETVPRSNAAYRSSRRERVRQAPVPTPVGELAPEFQITRWAKGGPIQLAALRGKTVVVAFSPYGLQTLLPILEKRPGRVVVVLLVNAESGDTATVYKQSLEGIFGRLGSNVGKNVDAAISYVGQDLPVLNEWRGFNGLSLGAGYGSAIIDPQGRIIATSLWGLQLAAKVDQLSE